MRLLISLVAGTLLLPRYGWRAGELPTVANTAFGTINGEKGHGQRQFTFGLKALYDRQGRKN